jgi:hypothetical protein
MIFVVQCAMNGLVETTRRKIASNASVDGLRAILLKPSVQFFQFLRL